MPLVKGNRHHDSLPYELNPAPVERLDLELSPNATTVANFFLTRAAERSWQTLNQHLTGTGGAVFWIGGPAGCGKTHFLNYAIALQSRAGSLGPDNARRVVCGLELAGRVRGAEVESYLLNVLAEQIGGEGRGDRLWREMRGADALTVALESARRVGIKALTVALDFGISECDSAAEFFAMLSSVAEKFTALKFTVIAAGRDFAPVSAHALETSPADASERMVVTISRARTLAPGADTLVAQAYAGTDAGEFERAAIFPFHPSALKVLQCLAPSGIASLVRLVREALAGAGDRDGSIALVYPADLLANAAIARRIEARIAEPARAALEIARGALSRFGGNEQQLAREVLNTLVAEFVCVGDTPLALDEIEARVPMLAQGRGGEAGRRVVIELLRRLEAATGRVVRVEGSSARFDAAAASAPEVAAFNLAIPIARRFDADLVAPRDGAELEQKTKRLGDAMSRAVEAASRTGAVLSAALAEARMDMPQDYTAAIEEFVAIARGGATELIEMAVNPRCRDAALATLSAYEAIAATAALVPRMRAMREYLEATGLRAGAHSDGARESGDSDDDRIVAELETERELLGVELGPRVLTGAARNLDALEARFHKFKWTYVQHYLRAHERWRLEMDRQALVADDARRYLAALNRLDAIAALGPPAGADLNAVAVELSLRIARCDAAVPPAPETTPRCAGCGFTLGAHPERAAMADLMAALQRALAVKLAALSQSMIARLIRDHDRDHRLDGFLKITQAAQTDALVGVLDEKLARYLARLLDENLAGGGEHASPSAEDYAPPLRALKSVKQASKAHGARVGPPRGHHNR